MRTLLATIILLTACNCAGAQHTKPAPYAEPVDPKERTFWEVCLDIDEETQKGDVLLPSMPEDTPPHKPDCDSPVYMKYTNVPIKLINSTSDISQENAVKAAAIQWNTWLGFELVSFATIEDLSDVSGTDSVIVVDWPGDNVFLAGLAEPFYMYQEDWACIANVFMKPGEEWALRVLEHELGHCLGLSHDGTAILDDDYDVNGSIMKQTVRQPDARLTAADRKALRDLYGMN